MTIFVPFCHLDLKRALLPNQDYKTDGVCWLLWFQGKIDQVIQYLQNTFSQLSNSVTSVLFEQIWCVSSQCICNKVFCTRMCVFKNSFHFFSRYCLQGSKVSLLLILCSSCSYQPLFLQRNNVEQSTINRNILPIPIQSKQHSSVMSYNARK